MATTRKLEVAIIGGGIAGITLAIALGRLKVPVSMYEQAGAFGEIGAGVSFSPNAVQAMKMCDEGVHAAFERVCTRNTWPSKRKVWFDFVDGHGHSDDYAFTLSNSLGQNGVHRAHFLDEMVHLVPDDVVHFGKKLCAIAQQDDGRLRMAFEDGTAAEADGIVGCDGIKSLVRRSMFGEDAGCAHPSYTHKYAYRGLVDMKDAVAAVGEERAQNACIHMGPGGHVLTFPVKHGEMLNIVAFVTDRGEWPDPQKLTRPATRQQLLDDFSHYSKETIGLLKLTQPSLDVWAVFDLLENPPPSYNEGRVVLLGDAAHATSPHHGAGAGLCIEDSAVLAELLNDERVDSHKALEAAFATFDSHRRARGEWLMRSSRICGDMYEWQAEGIGRDFGKIEAEMNRRNGVIADVDVANMCHEAKAALGERLTSMT